MQTPKGSGNKHNCQSQTIQTCHSTWRTQNSNVLLAITKMEPLYTENIQEKGEKRQYMSDDNWWKYIR